MNKLLYSDDKVLLSEIREGNMIAFDELYSKYSRRIFRFAFLILKSYEDAENIVQDVFLSLWINRENIKTGDSVRYYIFTTAYNCSVSYIRKKLRENKYLEHLKKIQLPGENDVDLRVQFNELDEKIRMIVDSLPERQKEVFLLHRTRGLKYEEIAEKLGISVNTVETHMSRAIKFIRKNLDDLFIPGMLFIHLFF